MRWLVGYRRLWQKGSNGWLSTIPILNVFGRLERRSREGKEKKRKEIRSEERESVLWWSKYLSSNSSKYEDGKIMAHTEQDHWTSTIISLSPFMMHSDQTKPEEESLDSKEQSIACDFLDMSNLSSDHHDLLSPIWHLSWNYWIKHLHGGITGDFCGVWAHRDPVALHEPW